DRAGLAVTSHQPVAGRQLLGGGPALVHYPERMFVGRADKLRATRRAANVQVPDAAQGIEAFFDFLELRRGGRVVLVARPHALADAQLLDRLDASFPANRRPGR